MLRPREIDSELDAASLGSLAHHLLATFYKAARAADMARVTRSGLQSALELFDWLAIESEGRMPRAQSMGEQIDVGERRSGRAAWSRMTPSSGFGYLPVAHRGRFWQRACLRVCRSCVSRGIDRVDAGPSGLIVTDYKSTASVQPLVGKAVQHVLYALAAEQLLGRPVLGSVYRSPRSRAIRGFYRRELLDLAPVQAHKNDIVDETGYAEILERTEERVARAIEGIRSGIYPTGARAREVRLLPDQADL